MKQYFTGFFTAVCLTTSLLFFFGFADIRDEIIVKDATGSALITGNRIVFFDNNGKKSCEIGASDKGGLLFLYALDEKNGETTNTVSLQSVSNQGALVINSKGNNAAVISSTNSGGFISIYDGKENRKEVAALFSNNSLDGQLDLKNNRGNTVAKIGALRNDTYKGDGFINLFDRYGDYGWATTGKN